MTIGRSTRIAIAATRIMLHTLRTRSMDPHTATGWCWIRGGLQLSSAVQKTNVNIDSMLFVSPIIHTAAFVRCILMSSRRWAGWLICPESDDQFSSSTARRIYKSQWTVDVAKQSNYFIIIVWSQKGKQSRMWGRHVATRYPKVSRFQLLTNF